MHHAQDGKCERGEERTLDAAQRRRPHAAAWQGLKGSFAAAVGPWPDVASSSSFGNALAVAACKAAAAAGAFAS